MPYRHPLQRTFVERALVHLAADARIDGVLAAGSAITGTDDAFSDVDLVLVCRDADYSAIMAERREVAAKLGSLLAAFTGEHVGEPRVLICLYDAPVLHVDLKFVTADALAHRVETPRVLFDRDGHVTRLLGAGTAAWPSRSAAWFEERFWIWAHYAATKVARGELFEAVDLLTYLRAQILGPMVARHHGQPQRGVRRLEPCSPAAAADLAATAPRLDAEDCWRALEAAVTLYLRYRVDEAPPVMSAAAETAVRDFIRQRALSE
jgi:predicted nucleotidyltransferase